MQTSYITGWRIGEVLSRKWKHVDFNEDWIRLEPGETKNKAGRQFPLIPELREVLQAQSQQTKLGKIIAWVFHRNGEQLRSFRKAWKRACREAGCPGTIVHDFRRTAVRNLERAGVAQSAAKNITGHKTDSVYRRYAIVDEGMMLEASEKLSDLLAKRSVKSQSSQPGKVASAAGER